MKETVTVDPPKRVDAPRSILALLKAFPDLADDKYVSKMKFHKYKEAKRRFKEIVLDDKTKVRILFIGDVQKWAFKALPKLEAFLKDHVSKAELIETFPKPKLERNERHKCEVIMNPTAFANLCWRWKKQYLEMKK